jgi:uncharacterized membrane protein YebE (DUF533 family)
MEGFATATKGAMQGPDATLRKEPPMPTRIKPASALIYAMITMSAVDRSMSDVEMARIGSIVSSLPAFAGHSGGRAESAHANWLTEEAQACGKLLAKDGGLDRVLDLIADALPENLHETAYVLCAEIAASDLEIKAEEVRFLELLADKLGLDRLVCAALERAVRARHQKG